MARRLHRPTSTVSREVKDNGGRDGYQAMAAQRASNGRARRPKVRKLVANVALAAVVAEGLVKRWSPAEVAARLVLDHPDDPEMRVSHETIYTSLYLQGKGGLKRELIGALRSGRLRRRPRRRGENAKRANVLGPITPISARPPEAADRAFPGHWEGDLIMGAFNRSALVTVVERRSRFLLLGDLPEGHDAQAVYACLIELTADLPDAVRRSLTWDQGREMANWARLQADADIEVFFCDPVRHEAPCNRAVMKGHRRRLVAAGRRSWRQSDPGNAGEDGSSLDNAGTGQHCQMARVRQARREGVREEPVHKAPQEKTPARNLVDQGWFAVRTRTTSCGELLRRQRVAVREATLKACGVGVAIPLGQSWAPHPSNGSW
ncbi:MAG: IS30 family transposase [Actinomycetota bacterium]|nr:IS30 family transposase [Actinomycetota bacterium]